MATAFSIGPPVIASREQRDLLVSSSIGSIVEWYDFFVFASCAALVFDRVFFPSTAPFTGVLLSLMTYSVGFITRPIGGILFGILGDRHGRKQALIWSLILMGIATMAVGLIPPFASIGIFAPLLLVCCRLVQGLAVGGEVGGALILVTESLPGERRGFWAAWPMIGGPGGNLLSAAVLALLGIVLGEVAFADWGWRVAFLSSGLLIGIGTWMRTRIAESPLYLAYHERMRDRPATPLGATLLAHWREMLTVFFVKTAENALFYVFTTFYVVYVTRILQRPRTLALEGAAIGSIVEVAMIFYAGALSDRIGRRPVLAAGLVASAAWLFILFPATGSGTTAVVLAAAAIGGLCHAFVIAGLSPFFVELFPIGTRYTGFSTPYSIASVIGGAFAPIIGVKLLEEFHATLPVSLYALAMTLPALVAVAVTAETRGRPLDR